MLGRQRARQLEQRERVAGAGLHEPRGDVRGHLLVQEAPGSPRVQAGERESGQAVGHERAAFAVTRREEQHDALRLEPARCEDERVAGRAVEPMRVVGDAEDRPRVGRLREQAEHSQRDPEPVGDVVVGQGERCPQRGGLRLGQRGQVVKRGARQLMQPGEGQLRLRLHARAAQHGHPVGARDGVGHQGGLADARLAADHQHAAATLARAVEQRLDDLLLTLAADEHRRRS
ncbi:MAG TPA: hypothetical protein VGP78_12430 [Solirubrobacteraceae bacterium]|nr:hypothetical protein [Solirubrobacteraceae bacterium]